jgi:hypothetical protein
VPKCRRKLGGDDQRLARGRRIAHGYSTAASLDKALVLKALRKVSNSFSTSLAGRKRASLPVDQRTQIFLSVASVSSVPGPTQTRCACFFIGPLSLYVLNGLPFEPRSAGHRRNYKYDLPIIQILCEHSLFTIAFAFHAARGVCGALIVYREKLLALARMRSKESGVLGWKIESIMSPLMACQNVDRDPIFFTQRMFSATEF